MDRKDEQGFDLEDILREFGKPGSPEPKPEPEPVEEEVTGDTIRLDQISKAVCAVQPTDLDETVTFVPVPEEEEPSEEAAPAPVEEEVEPFSEGWEPEYEEPMGDYPAPEPIPFRRKSRLRELREKLVSGPERIYYSLNGSGVGKLQLSMLLCFAIFALCAGTTVLYNWGAIGEDRKKLLVFLQFLGLLSAGLLGCYRLIEGISDVLHLRFTPNSLLVVTFAVCCFDGVLCLKEQRLPVSAVFSLEMAMAIWGTFDRRTALMGQMDTLRRAITLDSLVCVPDLYDGKPGFRTGRGEVEHFMDHYDRPYGPERVLDRYALSALVASLAIGLMAGLRHSFSYGVQMCTAALLVGMPATAFLAIARPVAILEKRLHRLGVVLCGWNGVKAVSRQAVYPLEDTDLFPMGAIKLNGVKYYSDRSVEEIVSYATALIRLGGGDLAGPFSQLLIRSGGWQCQVESLRYYKGGVGGEIDGEPVLVGDLELMRTMGVDMGEGTRVAQAVYAAIDGELCGVFAVTYAKSRSTAAGLQTLCGYRGLTPIVACEDMMITESLIRAKFKVDTRRMAFPEREARTALIETEAKEDHTVVALTVREGLAPKAYAVTGARVLKSAMKTGVAVHMAGGILGLLIMAALAWVGGTENVLTPMNILLYELLWMLPGLLVTEWTRTI